MPADDILHASTSSRRGFLRGVAIGGAASIIPLATPAVAHAANGSPSVVSPGDMRATSTSPPRLVGDGKTNDAPAIQACFDLGIHPTFSPDRTYLIDSPLFLDRTSSTAMIVVDLNGATLKLGTGLPTTDAFWRDTGTKWAVFANTKRSALSKGKVSVSVASRATGAQTGALISLAIRNGTIDGAGANVGFVFANRTGIRFEGIVLRRGRTLLSWFDYSDSNVFLQCHNRAGGPANSYLVEQISSGDGLLMQSCKSDASVGLARLKYCRGAEIVGTVTGAIELDACSAVQIRGGHQEAPVVNRTMIDVRGSDVVIDSSAIYLTRGARGAALPPAIRITDAAGVPSKVVLRDSREMRALEFSDEDLGAFVTVDRAVAGTKIEGRGFAAVTSVRSKGGEWLPTGGPVITGGAALGAVVAAAAPALGSGDFVVEYSGSAWSARRTTPTPTTAVTTPKITAVARVDGLAGSLGAGAVRYRVQGISAAGTASTSSGYTSGLSSSSGSARIDILAAGTPQTLRIWRYRGTSTSIDAYLEMAIAGAALTLFDTGKALTGMPWIAPAGKPTP